MNYNIEIWFVPETPHPVDHIEWKNRPVIFQKDGFKVITTLFFEELEDMKTNQVNIKWKEIDLIIIERVDENGETL